MDNTQNKNKHTEALILSKEILKNFELSEIPLSISKISNEGGLSKNSVIKESLITAFDGKNYRIKFIQFGHNPLFGLPLGYDLLFGLPHQIPHSTLFCLLETWENRLFSFTG